MGCSYDPTPVERYPTPAEQWMIDNHFSEVRASEAGGPRIGVSYCWDCGQLLMGTRYGRKFTTLHIKHCPINPREEVLEKTDEELKDPQYRQVVYK